MLCCGYTLTDFPIFIRLSSLALWQSNDCPSASKATLMNMDKYFMWIHYERLHNHNKAKHNKTVCIFLGIYCIYVVINRPKWVHLQENAMYDFLIDIQLLDIRSSHFFSLTHWGGVTYMFHEPGHSLVQIMACCLAKPLSETVLEYCWLDHWEQTSVKCWSKFPHFHSGKCIWKCHLGNVGHFVSPSMC